MGLLRQPVTQVRHTNVAVVRLRRGGKRFEIACYKNKVLNWRNGVEKDIDEVLQTTKVYENVSKGRFAKKKDWVQVFGVHDDEQVCRIILDQGELQVSEGERKAEVESMFRDIATIVADKCVNPSSNRPYPFSVIERVMREIHYAVVPNRSAKQQALEVIKKLKNHIPIARAKMKLQITIPSSDAKLVRNALEDKNAQILEQSVQSKGLSAAASASNSSSETEEMRLVVLIEPGLYRAVDTLLQERCPQSSSLEVLELSCHEEGEHTIDEEISKKTERMTLDTSTSMPPAKNEKPAPSAAVTPPPSPSPATSQTVVSDAAAGAVAKKGRQCSTCGGDFADVKEYRDHFRSEWHRYNLKRKSKGLPIVDEATFDITDREEIQSFFESLT